MTTATRSFDRTCAKHETPYPLRADGSCPACELVAAQAVPPSPPNTTWDREYAKWLYLAWELEASQMGDERARRQKTREMMERVVAMRLGLAVKYASPPSAVHDALTTYYSRHVAGGDRTT